MSSSSWLRMASGSLFNQRTLWTYARTWYKNDATGACRELILEAAAKWNEEEGDYRDDITCMVVRVNPLDHAAADLAYLPAAADELEHQAGNRQRTSNRKVGSGKKTVLLDTKGAGTIDTAGVDTTGDGTADTFYPAEKVDGNVVVHTDMARKASNFIGGNKNGGTQQPRRRLLPINKSSSPRSRRRSTRPSSPTARATRTTKLSTY